MSTTSAINRVTTGPFEMEGVEWIQFGHFGLVRDLQTARAAAEKLKELGFQFYHANEVDQGGVFYNFAFSGDYDTPTHHFEIVTITMIAVDYGDRPQFEIIYYPVDAGGKVNSDTPHRFGTRTYVAEAQVDGLDLARAYDEHGRANVRVRPTLWP